MKSNVIAIHSKTIMSLWIYVKIRYENFHCSVIVDNMKEDCVLLEKIRKLRPHVVCAMCPRILKGRKSTEA